MVGCATSRIKRGAHGKRKKKKRTKANRQIATDRGSIKPRRTWQKGELVGWRIVRIQVETRERWRNNGFGEAKQT